MKDREPMVREAVVDPAEQTNELPSRRLTAHSHVSSFKAKLAQPVVGFEVWLVNDAVGRLPERMVVAAIATGLQLYDPMTGRPLDCWGWGVITAINHDHGEHEPDEMDQISFHVIRDHGSPPTEVSFEMNDATELSMAIKRCSPDEADVS